jgi:hypothetical protein
MAADKTLPETFSYRLVLEKGIMETSSEVVSACSKNVRS